MMSPAITAMVKESPKILIVDDEPTVIEMLTDVFRGRFSCEAAASGSEALAKLGEWPADLVLTDVDLPDMSGFDLIAMIREVRSEIPCIAMSGRITGSGTKTGDGFGPVLISKPIDIGLLEHLIDEHFRGGQSGITS